VCIVEYRPSQEEDNAVTVITVFRQAGCEGRYVAQNVAKALNYVWTDYRLAERILLQQGIADPARYYDAVPDFWDRFTRRGMERDHTISMLRSLMLATAHQGNVVMLGRGCFASLQGLSDVLNVRVKAALPVRIDRVMRDQRISYDEAKEFVAERDALVADLVKTAYGVSADDHELFDLVIDTGKVDRDAVVRFIVEAARTLPSDGDGPTAATLQVDAVMAKAVATEFKRRARLRAKGLPG
jgi:cytidylate kinase